MDFDAIVVGAGPAGCVAARDLAFGGWRVALFDVASREALGRTAVVEVEQGIFRRVGLNEPSRDEIPYRARTMRVLSPRRRPAFSLHRDFATVGLYLDRFVKKLLGEAERAGASFFGDHRALGASVSNGRVVGARFTHQGGAQEARARLVIDATGFDAALVRGLDPVLGMSFADDSGEVLMASNALHAIEPDPGRVAVAAGKSGDEESWLTLGGYGPSSVELCYLSLRKGQGYQMVACKADHDGPPLGSLASELERRQGYFGERLYGAEGPIRVCRALDRLVTHGFMVMGEAACMVNPLCGSGVASALHAGTLGAGVAAAALSNREPSTGDLWRYAVRYQRGRGATLAGFDAARHVLESLKEQELEALLAGHVIGARDLHAVLSARRPPLSPRALTRRTFGLARHPALIGAAARLTAVSLAVYRHYRSFPESWDPEGFAAWRHRARRLFAGAE
jgi:flavin-dependent dehydrogenase